MRRFSAMLLLGLVAIAGCGGGKKDVSKVPTSIDLEPTTLSLEPGQVQSLTPTVKNSTGNTLDASTVVYTSSNTSLVQIAKNGSVCAGTWDNLTTPVNCTPATGSGTSNITGSTGGITSNTVTVYVHPHIARLEVSAATTACTSQTKTNQFTAVAQDINGNDITSLVGPITWSSRDATVATVDTNGLVTAVNPGATLITARASSTTSISLTPPPPPPASPITNYWTCPPASISISTSGSNPPETSYPGLAVGATKTVAATVIDTAGNTITANLVYATSLGASVGFGGSAGTGTVTATAPGAAGLVAVCSPSLCNNGLNYSVYSNVIPATVAGTSASTVYVTGVGATQIVPIDTGTHAVTPAISIPLVNNLHPNVNSMFFAPQGTRLYLGSDQGLLIVDLSSNAVSVVTGAPGKILTISPSGNKVVVSNSATNNIFVVNTALNNTVEDYAGTGLEGAGFTPESLKAYVPLGAPVFIYSGTILSKTITLPAASNDATVPSFGSAAFLAGGISGGADMRSTCDDSDLGAISGITTTPLFINSGYDGTRVFAVDANGTLYDATVSGSPAICPAPYNTGSVSASATSHALNGSAFTPSQMVVAADSSNVFVPSSTSPNVYLYAPATGTVTNVALTSGTAATTGGATLDGTQFFVGVLGTNDIHLINPATGTDVLSIAATLTKGDGSPATPDFVGVRPK